MATVSTLFGGLGSALGSIASNIGQGLTSAVQLLSPLAAPAVQAYALAAGGGGSQLRTTGVMPGGAVIGMPQYPTSSLVPYNSGSLANLFGSGGILGLGGGASLPGTGDVQYPGPMGSAVVGPARLPKYLAAKDARGNPRTYVLAPSVRPTYRVTMSVKRRGCRRRPR